MVSSTSEVDAQHWLPLIPGFHAGIPAVLFEPSGLPISLRTFKARPLAIVVEDRDLMQVGPERPVSRFSTLHLHDTVKQCDDIIVDAASRHWGVHTATLQRIVEETGILVLIRTDPDRAYLWASRINHWVRKPVRIFANTGVHRLEPESMIYQRSTSTDGAAA